MQIVSPVLQVLNRLTEAGYEAFVVGGCVRDSLMSRPPHDWDVTTNAPPDEIQRILSGFAVIPTGLAHGTVTVLADGLPVEVTTYRVDGVYTDHRHPDRVCFTTSLQEDLARRDFTVNAMAYHPTAGLVDPFCGQQDLESRLIRCVGDPAKRLKEDALRIMRALRFASVLSFSVDASTAEALRQQAGQLSTVSAERLYHELLALLCGERAGDVLLAYPQVLAMVIPEITAMCGCPQRHPCHCFDVYEHTAHSVAASPPDPLIRLTMLFHDAGKPACRSQDESGCDHFYGHAKQSAALAEARLMALKADRHTVDTVTRLVSLHDAIFPPTRPVVRRWLGRLGEKDFRRLLAVKRADLEAQAPSVRPKRRREWRQMAALLDEVCAGQLCFSRKQLAVNGRNLAQLGIPPGPAMGKILDRLLEDVVEERLSNEKDTLLQEAIRQWQQLSEDSTRPEKLV